MHPKTLHNIEGNQRFHYKVGICLSTIFVYVGDLKTIGSQHCHLKKVYLGTIRLVEVLYGSATTSTAAPIISIESAGVDILKPKYFVAKYCFENVTEDLIEVEEMDITKFVEHILELDQEMVERGFIDKNSTYVKSGGRGVFKNQYAYNDQVPKTDVVDKIYSYESLVNQTLTFMGEKIQPSTFYARLMPYRSLIN